MNNYKTEMLNSLALKTWYIVQCPSGVKAQEGEIDDYGLDDDDDDDDDRGWGEGKTYRGWPLTLCAVAPPDSLLPLTCTAPVELCTVPVDPCTAPTDLCTKLVGLCTSLHQSTKTLHSNTPLHCSGAVIFASPVQY